LDPKVDINNAWEMIRENIKISAKESVGYNELKKHMAMVWQKMLKVIRSRK
jgi:hypothetical protein